MGASAGVVRPSSVTSQREFLSFMGDQAVIASAGHDHDGQNQEDTQRVTYLTCLNTVRWVSSSRRIIMSK